MLLSKHLWEKAVLIIIMSSLFRLSAVGMSFDAPLTQKCECHTQNGSSEKKYISGKLRFQNRYILPFCLL